MSQRTTFGRVDAMQALLELLASGELLDGIQVSDAYQGQSAEDECIWLGLVSGAITQPVSGAGSARDQDVFTVPIHIEAGNNAKQKTSMDARARCEQLMSGVRQTVAAAKTLPDVAGLLVMTNAGADGPDVNGVEEGGWVGLATVRVQITIRMR